MRWVWVLLGLWSQAGAQSNYQQQAISKQYDGLGLNEFATLNGTVTELGDYFSLYLFFFHLKSVYDIYIFFSDFRKFFVRWKDA